MRGLTLPPVLRIPSHRAQKVQRGWEGGAGGEQFTVPQFASTTAGGIPLFQGSGGGKQLQQAPQANGDGAAGGSLIEGSGASGADQQQQQQQADAQAAAAPLPGGQQLPGQLGGGAAAEGMGDGPGPLHAAPAGGAAAGGVHADFGLHADPLGAGMGDHHGGPALLRVGSGAACGCEDAGRVCGVWVAHQQDCAACTTPGQLVPAAVAARLLACSPARCVPT